MPLMRGAAGVFAGRHLPGAFVIPTHAEARPVRKEGLLMGEMRRAIAGEEAAGPFRLYARDCRFHHCGGPVSSGAGHRKAVSARPLCCGR